jgi:hypothetical protein
MIRGYYQTYLLYIDGWKIPIKRQWVYGQKKIPYLTSLAISKILANHLVIIHKLHILNLVCVSTNILGVVNRWRYVLVVKEKGKWNNTIMIVINDITMGYLSLLSIRTIIVALQQ